MGLLSEGTPLPWEETKNKCTHVRNHGIQQFINHYASLKNRKGDCLKWGDEIEYIIVKFNHKKKTVKVSLRSSELLDALGKAEERNSKEVKSLWHPEYAEYMVEGTPGHPYGSLLEYFNVVEHNMSFRRQKLQSLLHTDEVALTITNFFRLGCSGFTDPPYEADPRKEPFLSLFFPEEAIAQCHPRFKTMTTNICQRRMQKIAINVPIFKDTNTPSPFVENFGEGSNSDLEDAKPDHIYLDAVGFGIGMCCLQITFQTCTVLEARDLYDQLTPLCPILLALSAATPIYRGYLSDVDCRWDVISASTDCRTQKERGLAPLEENEFVIPKSRYSSVDMYLSECREKFNDMPVVNDPAIYEKLINNDVDNILAKHIAHLFIRDSICLYSEKIDQDDHEELDHFENIQSTNWQTMRFKVPPAKSNIGWRVEFRPCEVQITDFENAAYEVFIALLARVILTFKLNMLMPISKVDENMDRSQKRNAVLNQTFWFRKDIFSRDCKEDADSVAEITIDEIINGKGDDFIGLVPLLKQYLGTLDCDADTIYTIHQYLKLMSLRASGKALTTASWIRNFVVNHPNYRQDSVVSESISYDLLVAISEITMGTRDAPKLLGGNLKTKTSQDIPKVTQKLSDFGCQNEQNKSLTLEFDLLGPEWVLWNQDKKCHHHKTRFGINLKRGWLVSYPCSGNTWLRYLLEASTGVFTGSLFADSSLYEKGYLGEFEEVDSGRTLLIKSHGPVTPNKLFASTFYKLSYEVTVLLIRNPKRAIVSYWKFSNSNDNKHLSSIDEQSFHTTAFRKFVSKSLQDWMNLIEETILTARKEKLFILHYENLVQNPIKEVRAILQFLRIFPTRDIENRLECLKYHSLGLFQRPKGNISNPYTKEEDVLFLRSIRRINKLLQAFDFALIQE